MIYAVRHVTTYEYESAVSLSSHRLRLTPRETARQRLGRFALDIEPAGARLVAERDAFGNAAHLLEIREPHRALKIEARSQVRLRAEEPSLGFAPWEQAAGSAARPRSSEALDAAPYAFPTRLTRADDAIAAYARASFSPGRPVVEAARELTARIYSDFAYDPEATTARTTAAEAFALKRGVCQDFAHVLLAACRAVGAPARYVSGYLLTHPPEGRERLVGADASHAWAAVWCPVSGWVDFDPTNDLVPDMEHVTCAWGRDYGDIGPVMGVVLGGGAHALAVAVDVEPLQTEPG